MMMLLTLVLLLIAVHLPLPAVAAPNLNINRVTGRPTSDTFGAAGLSTQVDPAFLLNRSTPRTPTISAQWNRTSCHGNANSASSGSSAFRGLKTGSAIPFRNSSYHDQVWNISSDRSTTTVTVTNCSQSMPQSTPEPKCNCPQLQTATIFVTVTATKYLNDPSSSKIESQTLPSPLITSSGPNTAFESSLEALPSPRTSSSQISSNMLATTSRSDYHSVEQASSTHNISLQPALFSNYPPSPNFITGSIISSLPTMSVLTLPTNSQSYDSTIAEPANTVPIGTAKTSSTSSRPCRTKIKISPSLPTNLPTVNSGTSTAPSNDNLAASTGFPEVVGGSTLSNPNPASSASLQPAFDSRPGSTVPGETYSGGRGSHPSTPGYSSDFPSTLAPSGSSAATPSQDVSLQSSLIQSYLVQTSSLQNPPQNVSASPSTIFVSSFTTPSIPAIPPAPSMVPPSDSPPINSQSTVLPVTSIIPPPLVIPSNITLPNPANPPYANISQVLNLTTSTPSTSPPPSLIHHTIFPTQGPHSPPRLQNDSLHTVMCFPNTTSITHVLANYDSPRLSHYMSKFYRGLDYTSFALTNQSASMSPPNCMTSPADAPLRSIAIASAPFVSFISFSLRSIALSCLQAETLPQLACTVLMTGTKAAGALPNGTSTSNQVKKRITITGPGSGTAQPMVKVDLAEEGDGDWTGLKNLFFDAEIDGKPAGLGVDDLEYDLKTKGCFFDAER